ncbi:cyclic nucleotide-binding protein [Puia dinghuensis]|uniref:Cyclic nucleotide-binding protein n=2 Tax=Puia dinghuensis TaxID=1792502 RepID=A0A8J2UCS6_9BACT|nr:cyclic nucleotide-binding protein [Puia dinghuensis]
MYDILIKYFNSYAITPLTGDQIDMIQSSFVAKRYRKRQYLLQEGEICKYSSFIIRGAMRQYRVDERGEEHIINLFIERWWASDRESFLNQTPSGYFIDAWEDTEALVVAQTDLSNLIIHIPALTQWIMKLSANFTVAAQRRISAAISLSAEERFYDLEKTYPEFLQRFPQHIIASYLGINRETLSRIRSRIVKR